MTQSAAVAASTDWTSLIQASASLAWPILVGMFCFYYRNEIRTLLKRDVRVSALGVEMHLLRAREASHAELPTDPDSIESSSPSNDEFLQTITESWKKLASAAKQYVIDKKGADFGANLPYRELGKHLPENIGRVYEELRLARHAAASAGDGAVSPDAAN